MKLLKNSIFPLVALLLLTYLGRYIYIVDGQVDWLRLCLVYGIPFGMPYMLLVIPIGGNPESSVAILALNMILGAVFGCLIALFAAIKAVFYLVWWFAKKVFGRAEP